MRTAPYVNRRFRLIEERTIANSPYSIALDGIKRFLNATNKTMHLVVPLHDFGLPIGLGLEHRVTIEFDPHPNTSIISRFNDRLVLDWKPDPPDFTPSFHGRLTIQPFGTQTEFILKGYYEPPLGALGAAFDAAIGKRIARATVREVLDEFRRVLEAEFATLQAAMFRIPWEQVEKVPQDVLAGSASLV